MSAGAHDGPNDERAYAQRCASYHAIDDFRTKLLGFLPLASGAGIFAIAVREAPTTAATAATAATGAAAAAPAGLNPPAAPARLPR